MLTEKQREREAKRVRGMQTHREKRLKAAALLSREMPAAEICVILDIDTQTLKRYERDPLWKQHGGADLPRYFTPNGRPSDAPDEEQELLTEAFRMHDEGMKWFQIADELKIKVGRLEYLRRKYPRQKKPGI